MAKSSRLHCRHGFMANQQTVRQYAQVLAKIGYCAYCFDFCGGSVPPLGRSDGATTDMVGADRGAGFGSCHSLCAVASLYRRYAAADGLFAGRDGVRTDCCEASGCSGQARAVLPGLLHPRRRARGAHDDGALRSAKPAGEDSLRADAAGALLSPKPSYTWTFSAKSRRTPGGC